MVKDNMSAQYIVVDLDGTIFDIAHRVDYAKVGQWDDFHSRCAYDGVHKDVEALLATTVFSVLAVTGRNEKYRKTTIEMLSKFLLPVDEILMRPDDDYRSDAVLKIELLEEYFGSKEKVLAEVAFCLDDRDKVIEAYRNYGLAAWQVRQGAY